MDNEFPIGGDKDSDKSGAAKDTAKGKKQQSAESGELNYFQREALKQERAKKRRDKVIFGSIILVFGLVFGVASYFDVSVSEMLQKLEPVDRSKNRVAQCRKKENKNTPWCQERRARTKSTWRSISRGDSKGGNAYRLSGRE